MNRILGSVKQGLPRPRRRPPSNAQEGHQKGGQKGSWESPANALARAAVWHCSSHGLQTTPWQCATGPPGRTRRLDAEAELVAEVAGERVVQRELHAEAVAVRQQQDPGAIVGQRDRELAVAPGLVLAALFLQLAVVAIRHVLRGRPGANMSHQ
jgi:hypothetical protein